MSCAWWDVQCQIDQAAAQLASVAAGAASAASSDVQQVAADLGRVVSSSLTAEHVVGSDILGIAAQFATSTTQSAGVSPIVIKQSSTVDGLISGALSDGWRLVMHKTLIADVTGPLDAGHLQLDAIEWKDLSFLGLGNTALATSQFQTYIEQNGSRLYAWAVMEHDDFDALGFEIKAYRLLLLHSQIQIPAAAIIAIIVAAFLAFVIWQYVTTGSSPALDELKKVWSDLVSATVNPIAGAAIEWWVVGAAAAGGIFLLTGLAGKRLGVAGPPAPKPPSFEGEVKTKFGRFGART